ncbi:GHKL domain-containing protein [Mucilaginibacter terrenus]|uniref:histidine kinase n=1 Tax=Mucilaginibacter terrenus TaxID=2482727 RepID=A0A3E2NP12_9SPHI|nr:ATP-binding protein [Mucilaginibacter terrenus]RFZ82691.1 GHKL domain-containing protein [Mucilaginibacter terrenus]
MTDVKLEELKAIPLLEGVPDNQLQWLIDNGNVRLLEEGERMFEAGEAVDKTSIILEGRIRLCVSQNGKLREVAVFKEQAITGYLPFSRALKTPGYGQCIKKARVLVIPSEKIKAAAREHYELTEALVHIMTTRVRDFTSQQQQNEKMFALGKLSAGLAHELNNPAAAITRGAAALEDQIERLPELFKSIVQLNIPPEKVDGINQLLHTRAHQKDRPVLSMMTRAAHEDDLNDWLDDHEITDCDFAENMVDFDFKPEDLDHMNACTPSPQLPVVLEWVNNYLVATKMISDIKESSQRVSQLVTAVKNFTHMDRATDKQPLDIHSGLRNTLTMLDYKLKKAKVTVVENFDLDIPQVKAMAGELNQVWTNIIDNAADAMEANGGGTLEITTHQDRQFVQVTIKDSGPGVPLEIQSQIFDPFFTTKDMGKGTGLGLDVVMRIVRQHNGSVKLHSVPGSTEFIVCFPISGE